MNDAAAAVPPRKRRWWWLLGIAVVLLLLIAVALRTVLRPDFATGVIIEQVGRQLGLEITTSGPASQRQWPKAAEARKKGVVSSRKGKATIA